MILLRDLLEIIDTIKDEQKVNGRKIDVDLFIKEDGTLTLKMKKGKYKANQDLSLIVLNGCDMKNFLRLTILKMNDDINESIISKLAEM